MLQLIGRTIRADSQTTSNYATGVIDVGSIAVRNAFPRSIYPSNHLSELHAKNEAIPNPIPCKPTTKRAFNFASAAATRVACQLTFTCLQPYKVRQKLGCQGCVNLPRFKGWDHAICMGRAFAKPIQCRCTQAILLSTECGLQHVWDGLGLTTQLPPQSVARQC